jgi:D-alanyl-D-alanine carboxypeptidase
MELTVRDLIYGVSYKSGADAVLCLIDYLGISMNEFVALMNQKAKEIGMTNTTFGGAIGMDSEENQSTCRDIAAMMTYAMENTLCVQFFGSGAYKLDGADMTYYNSTLVTTLNNMGTTPSLVLGEDYTVLATKSGLEDKAGYCLVSYIRNDVTDEYFILVTAKASRADSYPYNKNPILDMATIFNKFNT